MNLLKEPKIEHSAAFQKLQRGQRIQLSDVGKVVGFYGNCRLWKVENLSQKLEINQELPPSIYVLEDNEASWYNPLINRMSAGDGFRESVGKATAKLIKPFCDFLQEAMMRGKKIRQFVIPNGGLPMDLASHIAKNVRSFLPIITTSFAKISRKYDPTFGNYKAKLENYQGDKHIHGDIYLFPDTATASGSTDEDGTDLAIHGCPELGITGSLPESGKIFYFGISVSWQGMARTLKYCLQNGIKANNVIYVVYNAIIDVTDNKNILPFISGQTDLPISNELTITSEFINREDERLNDGVPICSVGDTGNRLVNTPMYFLESLLEALIIKDNPQTFHGKMLRLDQPEWARLNIMMQNRELVDFAWKFLKRQTLDANEWYNVTEIIFSLFGCNELRITSILNGSLKDIGTR